MSLAVLIAAQVAAMSAPMSTTAPLPTAPAPVEAAVASPASDLPPEAMARQALADHPGVAASRARVGMARAEAEALRRGPHEITLEGAAGRRDIHGEGGFNEFETGLSRSFRLPGKAALDRQAGDLGLEAAGDRLALARRDAALSLAALWYDWLRAAEVQRNAAELVQTQTAVAQATRRRVELRDAAELELEQAGVALAMAEAQMQDAQAEHDRARLLLAGRFPEMPLPDEAPRLSDPAMNSDDIRMLQTLIIDRSLETAAAAREAEREAVLARRARADRYADPSVGLRLFSERGGDEQGAGVTVSIPLGGGHRRALADQATASASAALSERLLTEREVIAAANADVAELRARLASWRAGHEAVSRAERSAALSARGQALGAIDLTDRLYAERQANEARRLEIDARAAARALTAALSIRAGLLWPQ
ncbi:TolC family protein [Brevundimonas diminuta]|uniref:TolC family protein n=1 Tax=Brevundimonas diminuta TaxID=293 RepID=UPI00320A60B5